MGVGDDSVPGGPTIVGVVTPDSDHREAIEVRTLGVSDVDVIESFEPAGKGFIRAMWHRQSRGASTLLVAWRAGEPLGSAEVAWAEPTELRNLNVRRVHRGQGVGTALIAAAEKLVGDGRMLSIGVGIDNPRAAALYERLGYCPTGERTTTTYEYVDDSGIRRTATETDETRVKQL